MTAENEEKPVEAVEKKEEEEADEDDAASDAEDNEGAEGEGEEGEGIKGNIFHTHDRAVLGLKLNPQVFDRCYGGVQHVHSPLNKVRLVHDFDLCQM